MKKEDKAIIVKEIEQEMNSNSTYFLVDFTKMKVSQSVEFRKLLRKNNYSYKVVKNRLALKALSVKFPEEIRVYFKGPTGLVFGGNDPLGLAKLIREFSAQEKILAVKAGIIEGQFMPRERFDEVCRMPNRDVMLGKIAFIMSYPLSQLLRTLQAPLTNMVSLISQLKGKKEEIEKTN